jgi:ribulose-5-phosphate 4-epimerase/fuculose-1-phosphate aldolase
MEEGLRKYENKLVRAGLAEEGGVLIGIRGTEVSWNRKSDACDVLEKVMDATGKQAILFAEPAEPYRTIIDCLAETPGGVIHPRDFETRIFLQDLPIVAEFDDRAIAAALRTRRGVIVAGRGIVTLGKAGPERAFVLCSSVCFACFVKFFSDTLHLARRNRLDSRRRAVFRRVVDRLDPLPATTARLRKGPFATADQARAAMEEAGRLMVEDRLVDSNFGNISYFADPVLYISRKGSALDELGGGIVAVPLDGASAPPDRASTEFPAHRDIVLATGNRAVLHGHPKFSVILSMDCEKEDCEGRESCHSRCPEKRFAGDIPIVAGEAGAGPHGLCLTVPPAMRDHPGVIVYGHGIFTAGKDGFNEAYQRLARIESDCRSAYFQRVS